MHSKEVLSEFIYKLGVNANFYLGYKPFWSDPTIGYSYVNSLPSKFTSELLKTEWFADSRDSIICVLADWAEVAEGIIFTDKALYVNSPRNEDRKFKVRYREIKKLVYSPYIEEIEREPRLTIETDRGQRYCITSLFWSKRNIHDFLQFAMERYEFEDHNKASIHEIKLEKKKNVRVGAIAAGITYSNVSNASTHYNDDKIVTPRGHGFAAENANHLADKFLGKDAHIVGNDNAPNGADRIVDGVQIQSKYCASGSKCVEACFDQGKFRYWNPDGTPMQIEVPSDKYDAAIQAMENRIKNGQVSGVTDPAEAKNIIRKGHFTYAQVRNIAKAGTVESITFDAASGAVIAANAFGVTAVLSFATAIWNGEDFDVALKKSAAQGLKVGGTSFLTAVLAGQLGKAGLNSALVGGSEAIVRAIGPKASAVLVNAFRSGTNIYGAAAMKSAAKLLRSNVITGVVSFAVLSIGDVGNIFMGRISGAQLFKNLTKTAANVAGGGAGWVAGAAAGAAIGSAVPILGTAVGGFIGGLAGAFGGGSLASAAAGAVLDEFIEDDADKMVAIIQEVFTDLAGEYLVNQEEAEQIADSLKGSLTGGTLKDMFASADRSEFARDLLEADFEWVTSNRDVISAPSNEQMQSGLRAVLEDIADKQQESDEKDPKITEGTGFVLIGGTY